MRTWILPLLLLAGCAIGTPREHVFDARDFLHEHADAAIVPGAPTLADGKLAPWQLRRILWAWRLYNQRQVDWIIVSGSAAYSRYVEAEALAAGLVALGVPAERIVLEPQALHTDENAFYSMQIAQERGFEHVVVASEGLQASGMCAMILEWSDLECDYAPLDIPWAMKQLSPVQEFRTGDVQVAPVPRDIWLPIKEREERRALAHGYKRPNSIVLYAKASLTRDWTPYPPGNDGLSRTYAEYLREGWQDVRFDN